MSLGTKHRQQQAAETCKQHLREKHKDKLSLVNEFIADFEGTGKNQDIVRWGLFTDAKQSDTEMLQRLNEHFEKWLNPG